MTSGRAQQTEESADVFDPQIAALYCDIHAGGRIKDFTPHMNARGVLFLMVKEYPSLFPASLNQEVFSMDYSEKVPTSHECIFKGTGEVDPNAVENAELLRAWINEALEHNKESKQNAKSQDTKQYIAALKLVLPKFKIEIDKQIAYRKKQLVEEAIRKIKSLYTKIESALDLAISDAISLYPENEEEIRGDYHATLLSCLNSILAELGRMGMLDTEELNAELTKKIGNASIQFNQIFVAANDEISTRVQKIKKEKEMQSRLDKFFINLASQRDEFENKLTEIADKKYQTIMNLYELDKASQYQHLFKKEQIKHLKALQAKYEVARQAMNEYIESNGKDVTKEYKLQRALSLRAYEAILTAAERGFDEVIEQVHVQEGIIMQQEEEAEKKLQEEQGEQKRKQTELDLEHKRKLEEESERLQEQRDVEPPVTEIEEKKKRVHFGGLFGENSENSADYRPLFPEDEEVIVETKVETKEKKVESKDIRPIADTKLEAYEKADLLMKLRDQIDLVKSNDVSLLPAHRQPFTDSLEKLQYYLIEKHANAKTENDFLHSKDGRVAQETLTLLEEINDYPKNRIQKLGALPTLTKSSTERLQGADLEAVIKKYDKNCYKITNRLGVLGKLVGTVVISLLCAGLGLGIGLGIDFLFGFASLGAFSVAGAKIGLGIGTAASAAVFGIGGATASGIGFFRKTELENKYQDVKDMADLSIRYTK